MNLPQYNKLTLKNAYSDDDKRFLLKNSKLYTLDELSKIMSRTPGSIKAAIAKIGCGYRIK
jgi:hypothetical protein